jgi:hypothetical protein
VAATGSLAAIPKSRFQGFGVQTPAFSAANLGLFNTGMQIGVGFKSLNLLCEVFFWPSLCDHSKGWAVR